ncbi:MAG TPA: VOC family protein [Candidatus Binatia bacterium]|nr:VOC family protein [Candidatus Binatia bacterium]
MAIEQTAVQYRFDHRHLIVDDVPKTVAFYEGVLGAKKVQELEFRGVPVVLMDLHGTPVNISGQLHAGVGDHIGLAVDDFDTAIADLRARGVEFIVAPTDVGFAQFAFIKDVAGTTIEVIHRGERKA